MRRSRSSPFCAACGEESRVVACREGTGDGPLKCARCCCLELGRRLDGEPEYQARSRQASQTSQSQLSRFGHGMVKMRADVAGEREQVCSVLKGEVLRRCCNGAATAHASNSEAWIRRDDVGMGTVWIKAQEICLGKYLGCAATKKVKVKQASHRCRYHGPAPVTTKLNCHGSNSDRSVEFVAWKLGG